METRTTVEKLEAEAKKTGIASIQWNNRPADKTTEVLVNEDGEIFLEDPDGIRIYKIGNCLF